MNAPPPAGFYDVVNYSFYPNLTILDYTVKARKNSVWNGFSNKKSSWGIVQIKNIQTYRNSLPSVTRSEFDAFISQMNNPSYWPKHGTYSDNQKYVVYRGGNSFTPKAPTNATGDNGDYRINSANGLVKTTHGLSLEMSQTLPQIVNNGGPYKIVTLPSGLEIIQRGTRSDHFEIVPTKEISVSQYKTLCSSIVPESAN